MNKKLVLIFCILIGTGVFFTFHKFPLYGATVFQGKGEAAFPDGSVYRGSFKDGFLDGIGEQRWMNGNVYVGNFKRGLFDGNGIFRSSNGDLYRGQFKSGESNGKGELITKTYTYEGLFNHSLFDGQGILKWNDGSAFTGFFKNNEPHGEGMLNRSDGSVWEGTFYDWNLTGHFTLTKEGTFCSGSFVNGSLNGQGKCSYSNGAIYEGEYKDNQPNGEGVMTFKEGNIRYGQVYKGRWKDFNFLGSDEHVAMKTRLKGIKSLEERVDEILKMDKVNMRLYIDDVFTLADRYVADNRIIDANRLLGIALEVDNWRLDYQMKHARILLALGHREEAIEKAKLVSEYTENPSLLLESDNFLKNLGVLITPDATKISVCKGMTIVLVPIGNVDMRLLNEMIPQLKKIMGIDFVISTSGIDESALPKGEQLDANQMVATLMQMTKYPTQADYTGYLGVTEHDLNTPDTNFVFGTAGGGYGVFSYKRYTAQFNYSRDNRKLLVNRIVKQAVCSAFLLLDIPRGTEPMSIRSYAHNLAEHDAKPMTVDSWSMGKLDELKGRYCH